MAIFRYDNKQVVITGAASGMGYETTRLLLDAGATVTALDVVDVNLPGVSYVPVDLGDPESIDAAIAQLPVKVDVLFNCAGIPGGTRFSPAQVMAVNILGLRHLTESLLANHMGEGSAVVHIASIAGGGWPGHMADITELLATPDFADGAAWVQSHHDLIGDGYAFSKEALQVYTMARSVGAIGKGIRINSICPGVTDTKIMPDFRQAMGDKAIDMTAQVGIGRLADPSEMAPALIFLGSDEASYVVGVNLVVDGGFSAAAATGQVDFAKFLA